MKIKISYRLNCKISYRLQWRVKLVIDFNEEPEIFLEFQVPSFLYFEEVYVMTRCVLDEVKSTII